MGYHAVIPDGGGNLCGLTRFLWYHLCWERLGYTVVWGPLLTLWRAASHCWAVCKSCYLQGLQGWGAELFLYYFLFGSTGDQIQGAPPGRQIFVTFYIFFWERILQVSQVASNLSSFCLCFQVAGITGMSHHVLQRVVFTSRMEQKSRLLGLVLQNNDEYPCIALCLLWGQTGKREA